MDHWPGRNNMAIVGRWPLDKSLTVLEYIIHVEQFSIECRKTKIKVIALMNHNRCGQSRRQ